MKNVTIRKYDYIDALRGFAIMGVVAVHTSQWVTPSSAFLSTLAHHGQRGVQLFFIASALTLFLSMSRRVMQESNPFAGFFIRRFFRIAPLFLLAVIVYSIEDGLGARYWAPDGVQWWYIALTAIFMHGWHPETINSIVPGGWSIAVEMTFYLFVPYLFLKLTSIRATLMALLLSLVLAKLASTIALGIISSHYPEAQAYIVNFFISSWFFSQLPIFILGILLFHIIKCFPEEDKTMSFILLFSALYLFASFLNTGVFGNLMPNSFLFGIGFLLFALALHFYHQPILVNWLVIWIGRLSFSIYIIHFFTLRLMHNVFPNDFWLNGNSGFVVAYVLVLALSASASYVTYRFIEVPGISFGKRIIEKI
ncbi:acyltransferase family protein [Mariprofundus ferrooxydans]|uniref:acyltransferase family protein n=1 Tax=Mariprofundus ferrooxydans TaxID=314344 RepID=UPI00142F47E7|nr:acyltransferase [Mariprofundus ferrooxydans]